MKTYEDCKKEIIKWMNWERIVACCQAIADDGDNLPWFYCDKAVDVNVRTGPVIKTALGVLDSAHKAALKSQENEGNSMSAMFKASVWVDADGVYAELNFIPEWWHVE